MSQKVFNLVSVCVGVAGTLAEGLVAYFEPSQMEAITMSIAAATSTIIAICGNFVTPDPNKYKKVEKKAEVKNEAKKSVKKSK